MRDLFVGRDGRTVALLAVSLLALATSFLALGAWPFDPAWLAIVLCGIPILKGAVVGLATAFDVKADVLVAIALAASVAIGEIFAAGEVAFIMALGAFLEERTVARARAGIERLVQLTPTTARVVRDGGEEVVRADEVRLGETLRVMPGETIAVDGTILRGATSVDQSIMTGESLPVDRDTGDAVFGGTVNQFGSFDMVATGVGEDSSLGRMIRLVESADAGKAKIVGLADRWATWIVVVALLSAVLTWAMTGEAIRAVTILVVFCPCALVLATPTAIMAGIGNATRHGILIREGDALERLATVKRIAFDKTGTLTRGCPSVVEVVGASGIDSGELLAMAAAAEARSEHPLGKAVVAYYSEQSGGAPDQPEAFVMTAGRGVAARIGGRDILAGNEALLADHGVAVPDGLRQAADAARERGWTVIHVAADGQAAGLVALSDTLRPEARATIDAIHRPGMKTVLLTGDSAEAAKHMAREAGLDEVRAGCLPEDKLAAIRDYEERGEPVCMVGDGINDAPALRAARVGIAMAGIGSDIAVDAADIALVGDNIQEIPHLLGLARKTMRTIAVNLTASMLLNFVAIGLAIAGVLSPVVGALVHNAGSVAVIVNSSLLLTWRQSR